MPPPMATSSSGRACSYGRPNHTGTSRSRAPAATMRTNHRLSAVAIYRLPFTIRPPRFSALLDVAIEFPSLVRAEGVLHRRRDGGARGRDVVLEALPADELQELLEVRHLDHAEPAERL